MNNRGSLTYRLHYNCQGETLVQLIVSMGIFFTIMGAATSQFFDASRLSHDHIVMTKAQEELRTVLDIMSFDVRQTGNAGVLGDYHSFSAVGTATPFLNASLDFTSDADTYKTLVNETGEFTVTTNYFLGTQIGSGIDLLSVDGLAVGDFIILSNITSSGGAHARGTISSIVGNTIFFAAGYYATSGARFFEASTIEKVSTVTYESPSDWSGITRNNGSGAVLLSPNSTFSIRYLDESGNAIALPLTEAKYEDELASIEITVQVRGRQALKDGSTYTAEAMQAITLRNLLADRYSATPHTLPLH